MATYPKLRRMAALVVVCTLFTTPALAQPADNLEALQANVQAILDAGGDAGVAPAAQAVADWVDTLGVPDRPTVSELTNDQLAWLLENLTMSKISTDGGFSATWTGFIEPTEDGAYEFSISPLDITTAFRDELYRQWMTVTINGQEAINATPEDWAYESTPIALSAGVRVPIQVTLRYKCNGDDFDITKAPNAFLSWKTPTGDTSLIPPTALFTAEGEPGLSAEYRKQEGDAGQVIASLVEPDLQHVWMGKRNFICTHTSARQKVVDELLVRMTDADYLDSCATESLDPNVPTPQHFFSKNGALASFMTSSQRAEFMTLLTSHPDLLELISLDQANHMFTRFRHGAHEESMEFLCAWMQLHADIEPELALDYFKANRKLFRDLTIRLVWQDRRGFDQLLNECLEMPDGSCCLPAAYTLAYGHLVQGESDEPDSMRRKITEWVELLDAKLADDSISGELRVNWLLAKAQAEEIRHGRESRNVMSSERLLAGRDWIMEAQLVAESEGTRLRLEKELVARIASQGKAERAVEHIDSVAGTFSEPGSKAALNEWRAKANQLKEEYAALQIAKKEEQSQAAKAFYRERFEARRDKAIERGDTSSAALFQQRLDELTEADTQ